MKLQMSNENRAGLIEDGIRQMNEDPCYGRVDFIEDYREDFEVSDLIKLWPVVVQEYNRRDR